MVSKEKWTPEICYEDFGKENKSLTSGIPFIDVPEDHNMPAMLFMYESRKVKDQEFEREIALHSYANMMHLKEKLDPELYDKVRLSLGLKPLNEAQALGEEINKKINKNIV